MRSKRERVGVAEARAERFFESPFLGLEKLFPVRVALSRFETFSAYVRDLLGAVAVKGAKRRTAGPLRPHL